MTTALLVIGNGRLDYLETVVDSALTFLPDLDHYLMVDDSGDHTVQRELIRHYPDFELRSHMRNMGMAAAVQTGFNQVLDTDADYVFWLEEDMQLTRPIPLHQAIEVLTLHPHLAQMCFRRAALDVNPDEAKHGDQLAAIVSLAPNVVIRDQWTEHDLIFSLNPCLIPRNILQFNWPAGPIGVGNETGFTQKMLAEGFTFGSWGHPGSGEPWARHLGVQRGKAWQL